MARSWRLIARRPAQPPAQPTDDEQRELDSHTALDADQTAADLDQTQSDADQTASDADQLVSDTDQSLADREQEASDRDQAASDQSSSRNALADAAHETSRSERDAVRTARHAAASDRSQIAAQRLITANLRDETARLRDLTAAGRDRSAQARDDAAVARERAAVKAGDYEEAIAGLRALRETCAALRRQAATERAAAAADREAAAADRRHAAMDRHLDGTDDLTGVFRRGTGERALMNEIERSRRSGAPLALVMIDVDALKAVNDRQGHTAGDALLRDVAAAITTTLRSYDVTVRWGGDEFVCALSNATSEVASQRLAEIQRTLTAQHPGATISAGHARLEADDTLQSLIVRADTALYRDKTNRTSPTA